MNSDFLDFVTQKVRIPISSLALWFIGAFYLGKFVSDYRKKKENKQREIDNFLNEEE